MRICDRCQAQAQYQIIFDIDDQRFDLCASCRQVVLELVTSKPQPIPDNSNEKPSDEKRKAGRPKKE